MKMYEWKEHGIELPTASVGFAKHKLFCEPYRYSRMICTGCFRTILEVFLVEGLCRTCQEKVFDKVKRNVTI